MLSVLKVHCRADKRPPLAPRLIQMDPVYSISLRSILIYLPIYTWALIAVSIF